jgi:hypothetical protein
MRDAWAADPQTLAELVSVDSRDFVHELNAARLRD